MLLSEKKISKCVTPIGKIVNKHWRVKNSVHPLLVNIFPDKKYTATSTHITSKEKLLQEISVQHNVSETKLMYNTVI